MKVVYSFYTLFYALAFLIFWAGQAGANTVPKMMQIDCDGTVTVFLPHEQPKLIGKYSLGDIARGMLYGRLFFSINDNKIVATNLDIGKTSSFGMDLHLEKNIKPGRSDTLIKRKLSLVLRDIIQICL